MAELTVCAAVVNEEVGATDKQLWHFSMSIVALGHFDASHSTRALPMATYDMMYVQAPSSSKPWHQNRK